MKADRWQPTSTPAVIGFGGGFILWLLLVLVSERGFVLLLDHANLLFHEAGHPIVGLLSERLEPYGGTIGQLAFPVVLTVSFWRKGQALSFAGSVIWFFENWLNIGRYMADARRLELPLVGGGDHDWNTIFSRWDVLVHDRQIAAAVQWLGWAGICATCGWVAWRVGVDRKRPEGSGEVAEL